VGFRLKREKRSVSVIMQLVLQCLHIHTTILVVHTAFVVHIHIHYICKYGLYQCVNISIPVHHPALRLPKVPSLEPVEVLEELLPLILVHSSLVMHVVAAPRQNGNVIF
jgi:hypothetical protein